MVRVTTVHGGKNRTTSMTGVRVTNRYELCMRTYLKQVLRWSGSGNPRHVNYVIAYFLTEYAIIFNGGAQASTRCLAIIQRYKVSTVKKPIAIRQE
jgi:hypothetical protein